LGKPVRIVTVRPLPHEARAAVSRPWQLIVVGTVWAAAATAVKNKAVEKRRAGWNNMGSSGSRV
jgi:hypothetical protein